MKKTPKTRARRPRRKATTRKKPTARSLDGVHVVGNKQLQALRKKIEKKAAMRWNPDSAEVQRSVIKLVLTLVDLIRKLMERQAIRRMEAKTMTKAETEAVGKALMEIER